MKTAHLNVFGLVILFTVINISCTTKQAQETANSGIEWKISDPETQGFDKQLLDSVNAEIENGDYGLLDHLLIIRNGKLIFDQHYTYNYEELLKEYDTLGNHQYNYDHPAWHPYYNYSNLHTLQSVTKSITSLLLGMAVDEGFIPSLDTPLLAYFPAYADDDQLKKTITLRHVLTMQTGLEWDEMAYDGTDDCTKMELKDDWISYVMTKPMDTIPGVQFEYNSGASVLLGKIVGIATGKPIDQWAEEKLFGPMDINTYYWKKTPNGEVDTEGGLYLSPQDLAKIGYLMLNKGKWENNQLISSDWIEQSIQPLAKVNDEIGYGFQWWVPRHSNGQPQIIAGNGYGGQFVVIIPEYNIVSVSNAWNTHDRPPKSMYRDLMNRILPNK